MRSFALVIALVAVLIVPAFAQKAEIEAVNAKWIDFFNKVISLVLRRSIPKTPPHFHPVPAW
jgi:hypothetical protein